MQLQFIFCHALALILLLFYPIRADTAEANLEWRMAGAFPRSALLLGTLRKIFAENATAISGGSMKITFFEPHVLAAPFKLFDVVSQDKVEVASETSAYWFEKDPAFALFSSVPFGPDAPEFMAWMKRGGDGKLRDKLYEPYGFVSIICGAMPPEAGGWYRREVSSIKDFDGLKMRTSDLGAQVLKLFGVEPQLIAPSKLIDTLQR